MLLPVDPPKYLAFVGVMMVMAATPGPANLFSIANGAEKGKRAVVEGVVGMNLASLTWFLAAALGLGALIAAFPMVFKGLAWLGAAYVAWLGIGALRAAWKGSGGPTHALIRSGRRPFVDGFMVQITNPKALLFFTAVLPPFVDVKRPFLPQLALFAGTTTFLDVCTMTAYGLGGAMLAARMNEPRFQRGFSLFVGVLLICAAVLIATR
jgi:threonine/homoserine/homoserine lactone efflux protein